MRARRHARHALGAVAATGFLIGAATWPWGGDGSRGAAAATLAAAPTAQTAPSAVFAAGACVTSAPVRPANGRTVFVDAGHGGPDAGATAADGGATLREKDLTLAIANETARSLNRRGYRVVLSRSRDSTVTRMRAGDLDGRLLAAAAIKRDIVARNACANTARADVAVSIHLNSFADPAVGGTETVYSANRGFSARNRILAAVMQDAVHTSVERAGLAADNRGIRTDEGAGGSALTPEAAAYGQLLLLGPAAPPWFTTPTRMPGAVVEALFLTNPAEARFAATVAGRNALARGLVTGIDAYFEPAARLS